MILPVLDPLFTDGTLSFKFSTAFQKNLLNLNIGAFPLQVKRNTHTHTHTLLSLLQHSKVSTSPLGWKESGSGCATIISGVSMGTAELCGLASCLGLWLNKQVKSPDKDARWSLQPHLHPQLPSALSASSSGAASPSTISPTLPPYLINQEGIVMVNLLPSYIYTTFFTTSVSLSKQTDIRQEAVDPAVCFI